MERTLARDTGSFRDPARTKRRTTDLMHCCCASLVSLPQLSSFFSVMPVSNSKSHSIDFRSSLWNLYTFLLTPSSSSASSGTTSDDCKAHLAAFLKQCLGRADDCAMYFTACPCSDKESRTKVHQIIRKYLPAAVDSEALEVKGNKFIRLVAKHRLKKSGKQDSRHRSPQWPAGLGDYLQFTLLKENVDTMSAASVLSRHLHMRVDAVKYAGTKDKRAVTSQRCTVYRKRPADLSRMNKFNNAPLLRLGDFAYVTHPLKLGALRGNHFSIVLRDVDVPPRTVAQACDAMQTTGFINYFGLQRFGRGGSKSHEVGLALLRGEWKVAVALLFTTREGDRPEIAEAKRLFGLKVRFARVSLVGMAR